MLFEYWGKCPSCENHEIDTLDTYDTRIMYSGEEVFVYKCKCKECGILFTVTQYYDSRPDEIKIDEEN